MRKLIYIMGSAVIGIVVLLVVMLGMMGSGSLDSSANKLVFSTPAADKVYDGTPLVATEWQLVSGSLREGHTVDVQVSGTQTQIGVSDNRISVTVYDKKGVDVTAYYQIEYQVGQLSVTARTLEISAVNAEKIYNGTPLVGGEWRVTNGSLAEGHTANVTLTGSVTGAGQGACSPSVVITDSEGEDVTANYDVSYNSAVLTVIKRHLTLLSKSAEKVYDGTPLSDLDFTLAEGSLPAGHKLVITTTTELLYAGEKENKFLAAIYDETGKDVTDNYDLTYVYGTLRVLPITISVLTGSAVKTYDGTPLVCENWQLISGTPAVDETIAVEFTGERTAFGESANAAVFSVKNRDGNDVTHNYVIDIVFGTLTVTPRGFAVVSSSATKEYDGTPLTCPETQILDGELAEGHTMTVSYAGTQTIAGSSENTFTICIYDENNMDVTLNYEPMLIFGALTVTKRALTVSSESMSKVYDGLPLVNDQAQIIIGAVAEGETAVIVVTGEQTLAGSSQNRFSFAVYAADGQDVTANYTVTPSYGTLTVLKRNLTLLSGSGNKIYDGTPLVNDNVTIEEGSVADDQILNIRVTGTITAVGEVENAYTAAILDANGEDLTDNYNLQLLCGTLAVTSRKITVRTDSASKIYDGTPLTNDTVTVDGTLADGQTADIQVLGTITAVGTADNTYIIAITDEDGNNITDNYDIEAVCGTLTVISRELVIRTESASKVYDGQPLVQDIPLIEAGSVADGQTADIRVTGTITDIGSVDNDYTIVITDENGFDVTDNYAITPVLGTLSVSPLQMVISTASDTKVYDGTPLTAPTYQIESAQQILPDHTISEAVLLASITNATEYSVDNEFTSFKITDENGLDVTHNYDIDFIIGTLTVLPRGIYIATSDDAKIYDGTPLTNGNYTFDASTLAPGQTADIQVLGTITDIGSVDNDYTIVITDENGNYVTDNYTIIDTIGTLTVSPLEMIISTASDIKVYDGTPLTAPTYQIESAQQILPGHTISEATLLASITNATEYSVSNEFNSFKITDENGLNVTHNYDIDFHFGTLTILPREIYIATDSDAKTYDGTPLVNGNYTFDASTLALGQTADIRVTGTITDAGSISNDFSIVITDENGLDVTNNYAIIGTPGTLTVSHLKMVITTATDSKVYDGTPLTAPTYQIESAQQILPDHTISEAILLASITNATDYFVRNEFTSFKITDENGLDVTHNYDIDFHFGTLTILPREIRISTGSAAKTYDGTPLTNDSYTFDEATLVLGQTADIRVTGTITDAGSTSNDFSIVITDENGFDVTNNYAIVGTPGTLTVSLLKMVITTATDSKVYDGTPLSRPEYALQSSQSLLLGHTISEAILLASITNVTDSPVRNEFTSFKITDENGLDVTHNYDIDFHFGTLTVLPREIRISTGSAAKTYDGTPLTNDSYTFDESTLVLGQTADIRVTGTITDAGSTSNDFSIVITDGLGINVTANYKITPDKGTLTVTAVPITVQTDSASKVYDGTPLSAPGYAIISNQQLLAGHEIAEAHLLTSVTDATDAAGVLNEFSSFMIVDAAGQDVTHNYSINVIEGRLTVTRRELILQSASDSKTYDGTPLTNDTVTHVGGTLVDGHSYTTIVTGTITDTGTANNDFTVTIYDGNNVDVTDNYALSTSCGTLIVNHRPLYIYSASDSKVYDRTPLTNSQFYTSGELANGERLEITVTGSQTNAGTSDNTVDYTIFAADGRDVTTNYRVIESFGQLTVIKRSITFMSGSDEKCYDGTPLTNDAVALVDGVLASDLHYFEAVVTGTITNAGSKDNTFKVIIYDENLEDVTDNYALSLITGTLTVTQRTITITSASANKLYDGTPLTNPQTSTMGELVEGDRLEITVTGSQTDAGNSENTIACTIFAADGRNVTSNYNVIKQCGRLTVAKKSITFVSESTQKPYDGTPLVNDTVVLAGGALVDGHSYTTMVMGTITDAGMAPNAFTVAIYDGNNVDVTDNYDLALLPGTLTVTKRTLTISSESDNKGYDGTPLTKPQAGIIQGELAEGERLEITVTGSQTNAGTSDNTMVYSILAVDGRDVTANYDISEILGSLTVFKRSLTFLSESDEKRYDGTPLVNDVVILKAGTLLEGHSYSAVVMGTITDAGTTQNDYTLTITDTAGTNVTANYEITTEKGTLTVTPVRITVQTDSASKVYDGTPLSAPGYAIISNQQLLPGHRVAEVQLLTSVTSATNAGVPNKLSSFVIVNESGLDVTRNYSINVIEGLLTVTRRELILQSASDSKTYDGTPLTNDTVIHVSGTLVDGHTYTTVVTGSVTNAGTADNTFTVTIYDGNNANVSANYAVSKLLGSLTVTKRAITVSSASAEKIYDNTPLTNPQGGIVQGELVDGENLELTITGSRTNAGTSDNTISCAIFTEDGRNVTENYEIIKSPGTLTVFKKSLTFLSEPAEKRYDGTPLRNNNVSLVDGTLVAGHYYRVHVTGTTTNAATVENTFTATIYNGNGVNVTDNYDIICETGLLTVHPIRIGISTPSAIREYNGEPLSAPTYQITTQQQLLEGHTITEAVMLASITNASEDPVSNEFSTFVISNEYGIDVTQNYSIDFSFGTLVILPRKITIRTESASKIYDGTELTCDGWKVVSITGPVEGHDIQVAVSGTQTEVGVSDNIVAEVVILNAEGVEITSNYDVSFQYGKLTVKSAVETTTGSSSEGNESENESGNESEESSESDKEESPIAGPSPDAPEITILRIKAQKDASLYLREKSYGNYTGRSWSPAPAYDKTLDGTYSYNYLPSVALENRGYESSLIQIQNIANSNFYLPYFTSMEAYQYDVQTSDVAYAGDSSDYTLYFYDYSGYGQDLLNSIAPYDAEEAAYREFVYENYTYVDDTTKNYMQGIIAAYGFNKSNATVISDVATYIQRSAAYNLNYDPGLDSEANIVVAFLSTYKQGICQHYASAATMLFRCLNIPARYTVGFVGTGVENNWSDVTTKQAHAWVEVYIDGLGWIPVEVTGSSGEEPAPSLSLNIRPADVYMQYDGSNPGKVLAASNQILGLEALLEQGYTYEAVVVGERSLPGITKSRIASFTLYDPNHNDVTEKYAVTKKTGKVQIYMAELVVTTGSASKVYDGTALTAGECTITSNNLMANHHIDQFGCISSLTNAGRSTNNYYLSIVDDNGLDVTEYYKITAHYGMLEITPRVIHIKANSAQKHFDNTPLKDSGYTLVGDVAEGETLSVTIVGSQTAIGRSSNTIKEIKITGTNNQSTISNYKITYDNGKLTVLPPQN